MLLRRALRAFAAAGAAAILLVALVLLAPPLPAALAWTIAYLAVTLALVSIAGFGWIVLTLPPGAPIRSRGLRVASALGAAILVLLAVRTGIAG